MIPSEFIDNIGSAIGQCEDALQKLEEAKQLMQLRVASGQEYLEPKVWACLLCAWNTIKSQTTELRELLNTKIEY